MQPVLAKLPPKRRMVLFPAIAAGVFLVALVVLALSTQHFFLTMLLSPALGLGAAYALVGLPELRRKDGTPLIEPKVKPYLFFALAPLLFLVLYPLLGVALTQAPIPVKWLAIVALGLAILLGGALAYLLVGFPNVHQAAVRRYQAIPPERRPFLFFPLFVLFFLGVYLFLGVTSTRLVERVPADPIALLNVQVLVLLPLSLAIAAGAATLLVGFPKPSKSPAEYIPKVTGRRRPQVFLVTFLLGGVPLTMVVGALLTAVAKTDAASEAFLPAGLVLPLALVLGYTLSLGIAALAWGTPRTWRRYEDYQPGLPAKARLPVFLGLSLATTLGIILVFGVAGLDLFWGLIVGLLAGVLVLLAVTGALRRILARRHESTLVPDLPDGLKPLILFPAWFLLAGLLFAVLTYALPGLVALNAVVGLAVGLAVTFLLLEAPLWKELREERRQQKEKRKAWEARRKAALAEEPAEAQTST